MTVGAQMKLAYRLSGKTLVQIEVESGVSETTILNIFRDRNVTVSNVFAVAATRRRREIGILRSLGVARGAILRLFLVEGAIIGCAGAAPSLSGSTSL